MNESLITPRAIMAYFWNVMAAAMLFYILVEFGKEKEILTLIIGIIGGTILGGIFGVYFGANHKTAPIDNNPVATTNSGDVIVDSKKGGSNES